MSSAEAMTGRSRKLVMGDLNFPTGITVDGTGSLYVAESGLSFDRASPGGRIWKLTSDENPELLAEDLQAPVNGLTCHNDTLFVTEGGAPARITRITSDGTQCSTVLENLPGPGNYHTNMAVMGPDDWLYFSQGAMTNAGIIGLDAYEIGWLQRLPHAHDIPGYEIELRGVNVQTSNPLVDAEEQTTRTGAFVPFGTTTEPGQRIEPEVPCTASVMRCRPDGSNLELVAWGLRNAYGLGFLPDGRLIATDQGMDVRGSRPVAKAPDLLFEVEKDAWYGWPDFIGGTPVTDDRFQPDEGPEPEFLLANHHELPDPESPLFRFPSHSAATKFDVLPEHHTDAGGELVVALFGDERPMTAPEGDRVGRRFVRVDPESGEMEPLRAGTFNRPIDITFDPVNEQLYLLDFGHFEIKPGSGITSSSGSGRLWSTSLP